MPESMPESTKKSSNTVLWVIGGLAAIVVFGFLLITVPALFLIARSEPRIEAVNVTPGSVNKSAQAVALPTPRVIVATPEGGVDYETAVFANIYEQVNPSLVNVTVLGTVQPSLSEGFTLEEWTRTTSWSSAPVGLRVGCRRPYRHQQPCGRRS